MKKKNRPEPKPINWHRPLRSSDYTQRYLRNRWAHVSEEHLISPEAYDEYGYYGDYYWDTYHPGSPLDYTIYKTWAHLNNINESGPLRDAFEKLGWKDLDDPGLVQKKETYPNSEEAKSDWAHDLEKYLSAYFKELMEGWLDPSWLPSFRDKENLQIIVDLIEQEKLDGKAQYIADADQYYAYGEQESPYLLCILFSPFWVRSPKTWVKPAEKGDYLFLHFVRHLFQIYPTPEFLEVEWTSPFEAIRYKWLIVYLLLAQGGSLKKAAPFFGWSIDKQFTKHFLQAPDGLSSVPAAIYSRVKCLGGSDLEFDRIYRNAAYIEDPTESSVDAEYKVFWDGTIKWLIRYRDQMTDEEVDSILEWAMHSLTEARYAGNTFSWRGRTPAGALRATQQYHEMREASWMDYYWNSHGWDWVCKDEYNSEWHFVELTSGKQLHEESLALHHCVESYAARCATHNSAIISVECNHEKILTIEINPQKNDIVQVKGLQNRFPRAKESAIVDEWYQNKFPDKRL